jgi:hypothetical protein
MGKINLLKAADIGRERIFVCLCLYLKDYKKQQDQGKSGASFHHF